MVTPNTNSLDTKVPFHFLPDELILMVFSYLNPVEVACSIAKVCSRWQKIARDAYFWENFDLDYKSEKAEEFVQVLSIAPRLHSVVIDRLQHVDESVVARMLHGCSHVCRLSFYPNRTLKTDLKFKLIEHYKNHLMVLNMYIDDSFVQYHKNCGVTQPSLFTIIADMPCLRQLIMRGQFDIGSYEDELAHGCLALEVLNICGLEISDVQLTNTKDSKMFPWMLFVQNILRNRLSQLKALGLPSCLSFIPVSETFVNLFKPTHPLKHLTVCEMSLAATKNLHHLQSLHIVGMKYKHISRWWAFRGPRSEYTEILSWISTAPSYPNLKVLILEDVVEDGRDLIPKLISTCKSVESLTVRGGQYVTGNAISALIKGLPNLKSLSLHQVRALNHHHLDLISIHLPQLRVLNLKSNVLSGGILLFFHNVISKRMPNLELQSDSKPMLSAFPLSSDSDSD